MMHVVDKENFEAEVNGAGMPVIVDIWGPSCEPCIALMPQVEELAEKYEGKIKFCKLNSAENRRLCITLRVMGLPSFLAFNKDGEEVKRISDHDMEIDAIVELAEELL